MDFNRTPNSQRLLPSALKPSALALAAVALLVSPLMADEVPPSPPAPAEAAATPPAAAVEKDPVWHTSLSEALAEAKKRQTYVIVDLYADWCGWCKQLEKKVFASKEFLDKARAFVLLKVDTEDGGDGSRLQALHGASSLPTTLILDHRGVRVGEIGGYAPTPDFLSYIDQQLDAWKKITDAYPDLLKSDDVDFQMKIAKELHKRFDGERAAGLYEALIARMNPDSNSYAWLHYMVADAYRIDRRFELAEKTIEKARTLAAKAEDSATFGEQLDLLRYYIAQDNGDCRGARSTLERFLEAHPQSQLRVRLQKALTELRSDSKCT